jgi:hypothetical protein
MKIRKTEPSKSHPEIIRAYIRFWWCPTCNYIVKDVGNNPIKTVAG